LDRAIKIRLGQTVREFRKQRGLTQAQLGRAAGVTVSQISNIETGHTPPSLDTRVRIARALRVPLPDMFSFDRTNGNVRQISARAKLMAMMNETTHGPEWPPAPDVPGPQAWEDPQGARTDLSRCDVIRGPMLQTLSARSPDRRRRTHRHRCFLQPLPLETRI